VNSIKKVVLTLSILAIGIVSKAQKTAIQLDPEALFKQGVELCDKAQFTSAQKAFDDYVRLQPKGLISVDARFYAAVCAIELFHKDAEWRMKQFIEKYPESTKTYLANFYLGKSNFRKKKYKECLEYLNHVDHFQLTETETHEFYFKRGYSYYMIGNANKAKEDFYEIKDKDNKYMAPALYYYSHICYIEKKYEIALQGFMKLSSDETFKSLVPYYITQIYFIEGKYETVTTTALSLLNDSANVQKENEIYRMIGESYYHLKDFKNALTYLKKTDLASGYNHNGNYALGYCYYKTGDCPNAIKQFEKVTEKKDSLAQNAWYHMADCYLKQNDKLKAKNAHFSAYQLNYDKKIVEDALFSFAKLCYELDFSPFNEAVKAFSKYLREYPNSPRREECYSFLLNVYSTTRNYDAAIKSIDNMGSIDPMLKVTYQKLHYFKGVDAFNNGKWDEADKSFKKSLEQNADLTLNGLNQYWMGEIAYLKKDYTTAIDRWKKFQLMEGVASLSEYETVNYNLGYAHFQRKEKDDFTNANIAFRKYLLYKNIADEYKKADANVRAADSYYMNSSFGQAAEFYGYAIDINKVDVDYAYFQRGMCNGLQKKYKEKISDLKLIESKFPNSIYLSQSISEIADTYYENLKEEESAITYYNKILKTYPNSRSTLNCYSKLGNIFYGRKEDDKALEYFTLYLKSDSKSEEAKNIMEQVKTIFKDKGQIDEMEKYFAALGNPLNVNQIEIATYETAKEIHYNQKNYDLAMEKWAAYISRFPDGKYILEAQFNYAECAYDKNLFEKALPGYLFVLSKSRSLYTETSLAKASYINYKAKNYTDALPQYMLLKDLAESAVNRTNSRFGIMRCAYYLNKFDTALTACNDLLANEKLFPQQTSEIKYIKAKCLYETARYNDALTEFTAMSKTANNISGAEALYYIALIHFKKQDFKEVEKTINKLIGYAYSNDDWNTKGMLLLADKYIATNEKANAEVILQTVIDSKPIQEYLDEAITKLNSIKEEQQQRIKEEEAKEEGLNIDFKEK